jgi:hypothetical protein
MMTEKKMVIKKPITQCNIGMLELICALKLVCVQVLGPLRLRYHQMSSTPMNYDKRYTPYIQNLGLLLFIHMVTRSTPHMNPAAITALLDRRRPETHSFHLRTGEMTVTLEDMAIILALSIEGIPLCIDTSCDDWRGKCPGDTLNKDGVKLRVAARATFKRISDNFNTCPEEADEDVVKMYARVYVWYVITRTLFNDASGKTAQ